MEEEVKSKRGPVPIHPPLLATVPVLAVVTSNINLVPMQQTWRPLGIVVLAVLAAWGLLSLAFRSLERGAMGASAVVLATILHAILIHTPSFDVSGAASIIAWASMALVLGVILIKTCWTKALNIVALMTFLVASFQVAAGYQGGRASTIRSASNSALDGGSKPDVYFIVLDAYASSQTMSRVFQRSNIGFLDALEKNGFKLVQNSRSNYVQTELSLAATLNMNHMVDLLKDVDEREIADRQAFGKLIDQAKVVEEFRDHGYQVVSVTSRFPPVRFDSADVRLDSYGGMTMIEGALIQMTPFGQQKAVRDTMFSQHRQTIQGVFANLRRLGGRAARPRLILAHVLSPHPPFVFGPNGESLRPPGGFGFWDGSDFMLNRGTRENYLRGYSDQATYIEGQVIQTVDEILASSKEKPIIIIQSDHGSKLGLEQNSLKDTDIQECFTTLNAILAPDAIREKLYPGLTPVNTFRVILPELLGGEKELVPDRSYWSPYGDADDFTDVTDRIAPTD